MNNNSNGFKHDIVERDELLFKLTCLYAPMIQRRECGWSLVAKSFPGFTEVSSVAKRVVVNSVIVCNSVGSDNDFFF